MHDKNEIVKSFSPAGNRTPVSRVTGGDTYHYTTEDLVNSVQIYGHILNVMI